MLHVIYLQVEKFVASLVTQLTWVVPDVIAVLEPANLAIMITLDFNDISGFLEQMKNIGRILIPLKDV